MYRLIGIVLFFFLGILFQPVVFAQTSYTVSGYVKEAKSGEVMVGTALFLENTEYGIYTNDYGFFSLSAPQGEYVLIIENLGYKTQKIPVSLTKDVSLNVKMETEDLTEGEVLITDQRRDENVKSTEMGKVEMNIETVKKLPVLLGEVDIMKTIQLLPGVQAAEGTTGLYVRGGGPDQNLILLDEAPVYNPGHLLGFFSVFNGDAVKDFTLYKGNMPAQYGGRLASVVDVSMRDGNNQSFHGKGGVGLIASRFTLEGPIAKDKASFIISGRRTYADALAQPFVKSTSPFKGSGYYFYDLTAKANYIISNKDRILISGYLGRDIFSFNSKETGFKFSTPWGNTTATVRWNHLFNDKLFMNTTLIFSDYDFKSNIEFRSFKFRLSSHVRDYNAKWNFDYYPNTRHRIKFGANAIHHTFDPNGLYIQIDTLEINRTDCFRKYNMEYAVYVQDEFDITDKLRVNAGLRLSAFQHIGPYKKPIYNIDGEAKDTVTYNSFQNVIAYAGFEPRISVRYAINTQSSIKASFNENSQYVHMVSVNGSFPSDFWVPSSETIRPQRGEQYSIGYFQNLNKNMYEISVELFYRKMRNQVEYNENYTFDIRSDYEREFVYGLGQSYGMELFLQKTKGRLTGWLGYTLARTFRVFNDSTRPFGILNGGEPFPYTYDRRHNVSFVATYEMEKIQIGGLKIYPRPVTLSGVFVYGTGNAFTPPTSYAGLLSLVQFYTVFGDRNSARMQDYHRADISMTLHGKTNKKFRSNWVISVYNAYNRFNPYFYYFPQDLSPSGVLETKAMKVVVFPVIPSITWDFEF